MPAEGLDWAAVPAAFGAGCVGAWGFFMKNYLPQRMKSLEERVENMQRQIETLQGKANKWDEMNERLAASIIAKREQ